MAERRSLPRERGSLSRKLRTGTGSALLFLFCATHHDTNAALFRLGLILPCSSSWILSAVLSTIFFYYELQSQERHDCAFRKACARVYLHTLMPSWVKSYFWKYSFPLLPWTPAKVLGSFTSAMPYSRALIFACPGHTSRRLRKNRQLGMSVLFSGRSSELKRRVIRVIFDVMRCKRLPIPKGGVSGL